ncbi:MAG TPA: 2-oxoacid:acceptor oxidoreductase family protein [Candidatus Limnocylindrales bacterium]|nr:2-oxoacid:acceptor oxidoreductase family protein [Candidatus Limnocylindrales bacterium]
MERSTIIAGFGGQGILFAGTVLARAAMTEGQEVLWIPSYGPEMRGGTASCTVILGDTEIGSPVVDHADAVVALNPPSLARFEPIVAPGGLLVINTSLIEAEPTRADIEVVRVPCTQIAKTAGDDKLVSVVALGALLARRGLVRPVALRAAIEAIVSKKRPQILEADLAAFEAGFNAAAGVAATT